MLRLALACVCATILTAFGRAAAADQDITRPPTTYEVVINGESFRVEADRVTKVQSAEAGGQLRTGRADRPHPSAATEHRPAGIRHAGQRLRRPRPRQRTVQIRHQLGFNVLLTDLGGPLDAKDQKDALKARIDSVVKLHQRRQAEGRQAVPGQVRRRRRAGDDHPLQGRGRAGPYLPGLRAGRPEVQRRLRHPVPGRGRERRAAVDQEDPRFHRGAAVAPTCNLVSAGQRCLRSRKRITRSSGKILLEDAAGRRAECKRQLRGRTAPVRPL